jgi:DNA-binding PadR family transcriptional regulator
MLNDDWLPLWKAHKMGRHLRRHFDRHGFHWASGGPRGLWAAAGMTVRRGDMKFRILELLVEGPRHGYQIIRDLEERNEGYRASPGSVYPTLQMLEDGGFVKSETVDGKRVYTIADAGRTLLTERAPENEEDDDERAERAPFAQLRDSAMKLGAAAMQAAHDPAAVGRVVAILDRARREIYAILAGDAEH